MIIHYLIHNERKILPFAHEKTAAAGDAEIIKLLLVSKEIFRFHLLLEIREVSSSGIIGLLFKAP